MQLPTITLHRWADDEGNSPYYIFCLLFPHSSASGCIVLWRGWGGSVFSSSFSFSFLFFFFPFLLFLRLHLVPFLFYQACILVLSFFLSFFLIISLIYSLFLLYYLQLKWLKIIYNICQYKLEIIVTHKVNTGHQYNYLFPKLQLSLDTCLYWWQHRSY